MWNLLCTRSSEYVHYFLRGAPRFYPVPTLKYAAPCLLDFEGEGDAVVKRIRWGDVDLLRLNFYNDDYTSNTQGERRENRSLAKIDGIR